MTDKTSVHAVLVSDGPGHEGVYTYASVLPVARLTSYARVFRDGALLAHYDIHALANRTQTDFDGYIREVAATSGSAVSIWLVSSYVWNHANNLDFARKIKAMMPRSIVIAGGPHIPAYEADARLFLEQHPEIDIAVRGEGEIAFAEILDCLAAGSGDADDGFYRRLAAVTGLAFRQPDGTVIRTADRLRNKDMGIYPSPYLSGELDDPSFNDQKGMMLETNRGCPFGCTFCDWGSATLQKFSLFDLDLVKREIDAIAAKRALAIYLTDSNFGAFDRDVEIAQYIADTKQRTGYPVTFGSSFAKNASERLAKITRILNESKLKSTGMISIQTTDPAVLATINRANIRQDKHEKLIRIFRDENMVLSSELMIGLPGQTVDSHKRDLQYFFDRKLMTVAFCTQMMPNAPMNEPGYRAANRIVCDQDGFVVSTSTFSEADYQGMIRLFLAFQFFYTLGVLKYFLYYLQIEHGIPAMDFIIHLLGTARSSPSRYPINHRLEASLLAKVDTRLKGLPTLRWNTVDSEFLFNHLDDYHREVIDFLAQAYSVTLPADEQGTVLTVQQAIMPVLGKTVPFTLMLEHDFAAYFEQVKRAVSIAPVPQDFRPLRAFRHPTSLTVKARSKKTINNLNLLRFDLHTQSGWELKSPLRA